MISYNSVRFSTCRFQKSRRLCSFWMSRRKRTDFKPQKKNLWLFYDKFAETEKFRTFIFISLRILGPITAAGILHCRHSESFKQRRFLCRCFRSPFNGFESKYLHPMEPDILGEQFVQETLQFKPEAARKKWVQNAWNTNPQKFSNFLERLVSDFGQENSRKSDFVFQELVWIRPNNTEAVNDYGRLLFSTTHLKGLALSKRQEDLSRLAALLSDYPSKNLAFRYAKALFHMISHPDDLQTKRRYLKELSKLTDQFPSPEIPAKRKYLSKLGKLLQQYPNEKI